MDSTLVSNAVVSVVGMYAAALAEKDREKQQLREEVRQRDEVIEEQGRLFAPIARALEKVTPGLRVDDFGLVAQLAVTAIGEGRGLFERAAEQQKKIAQAKEALRELGKAAFPSMSGRAPDGLLELIACVAKDVVDLKVEADGLKAEVQAFIGRRAYDSEQVTIVLALVQAAREYGMRGPGVQADRSALLDAADTLANYELRKANPA